MLHEEESASLTVSKNLFPIVGIGASAGGLDAFKKLITAIPEKSGMAYVLVQHLHPSHESSLPEILQRITSIPVIEISDNVHVEPNHIYVIPSGKMLGATDGVLQLTTRPGREKLNLPINKFFSSLAEVHLDHAIGVILSGTGSDGTIGLEAIKNKGGITFAQDPYSAAYGGMPQHAIDQNVVDFVLPVESIPSKLLQLRDSPISAARDNTTGNEKIEDEEFHKIFSVLKARIGVDFNLYKQPTIRRRIQRRMDVLKMASVTDYEKFVHENAQEQQALIQDLLIGVMSFFRDQESFSALSEVVLPELLKSKTEDPLRVWIAGCSTGQEAYSVAMCVHEQLAEKGVATKFQLFATDISEKAVIKARSAVYSKKEVEKISEARLTTFFDETDGSYQVKKSIRNLCVFAVHNFLHDPPFSNVDLICCRNVLIYLEPFLQKKAFGLFHYALNENGVLLLGKAETAGNSSYLFSPFNQKQKAFLRKAAPGKHIQFTSRTSERESMVNAPFMGAKSLRTNDFKKSAEAVLLAKHTPAGVIVNEHFEILHFYGLTEDYLMLPLGKATLDVLKMARKGLSFELRNALHKREQPVKLLRRMELN